MKLLLVHKQLLFPRDTGGKIRLLNLLRHLPAWHQVTCLCNIRPGEEQYVPEMKALGVRLETVPLNESRRGSPRFFADLARNLASPNPFTVDRNYDPALRARLQELLAEERYDVLACASVQMTRHVLGIRTVPKILLQHNIEAQILHRHATTGGNWLRARYMGLQWKRMRRFEAACGRDFDAVVAVSQKDRQTFEREYDWPHVRAIDTAVDLDYFAPRPEAERPGSVVFVGSMDWLPNRDGVIYFVQNVWPMVRQRHPGATFKIVGRNPPPAITRLAGTDGIEVTGSVPDVRPHVAEAAVVVVPLLVGGGTRIKIFEAMAMARAVVSTTIGAEGLPVQDNRDVRIADEPADLADAVASLLDDEPRRRALGEAGYRLVTEAYGTEAVARQFEQICLDTIERASAGRPAANTAAAAAAAAGT